MIREILGLKFSGFEHIGGKKGKTKLLKNATDWIAVNGFFRFSIGYNSKFTPSEVNFATNRFFWVELPFWQILGKTQNYQTLTFFDQARIMMKNRKTKLNFRRKLKSD